MQWDNAMRPLWVHITPCIAVMFVIYTAFVFFAIFNVVTSYFVDNTIRSVEEARNTRMAIALWELFVSEDGTIPEGISKAQFNEALHAHEMKAYLSALDLTEEDVESY